MSAHRHAVGHGEEGAGPGPTAGHRARRSPSLTVATRTLLRGRGAAPDLLTDRSAAAAVLSVQAAVGARTMARHVQRARANGQPVAVATNVAALSILGWLNANPPGGQAVNYCVGEAGNGDLYISKVGGVTQNTAYLIGLQAHILANNLDHGRDIILAQTYNTAVGSNHAEMCIMAAAGVGNITIIHCTGPHCGFCAAAMTNGGVGHGAAVGGANQMGWAHPYAPLAYGQQYGNTATQLAELTNLPNVPTQNLIAHGAWLTRNPAGRFTLWL